MKSMKLKKTQDKVLLQRIRTFCAALVLQSSVNEHLICESDAKLKKQNKLCRYQRDRSLWFFPSGSRHMGGAMTRALPVPKIFLPLRK